MPYFVYLLQSRKDNQFYIGQTDDIEARMKKHNSGKVRSTKNRRPLTLLGYREAATRKNAVTLERTLKTHSDKKLEFIKEFMPDFEWKSIKSRMLE